MISGPYLGVTTALAPKTQLGRYQLVRHLASGGMADLWLARATGIEGFERHVAIKRIRREQARDQRFVQMFLDEARLAASLHHNNIATVHDIGQTAGEYFFAMEYVHGEDLRKILMHASAREQYIPIEHVMTIVLSATAALHYAHEHKAQIVHRDVSPANVIVGYDGNVKVLDFGIAKAAHRTKETQSGVLKGKVAYMSPEQCVGQPVDRRSDLFSLGIVLYELVTVRRLFKGENDFLTMSAIIHGHIPPPSTIRPGIPRELEAIIMKALQHERADRFQTAEEMRAACERFCVVNHIRTSTTVLADYMRSLFGMKPEPWTVDFEPELALTIDFDGTLPGVVKIPEAALKRAAVPSTTPIQPTAPIMKARTKAITGSPPHAPAPTTEPAPEMSAPGTPALDEPVHEPPRAEGPLHVGDETLMVRPVTAVRGVGRQLLWVALGAALCVGLAFVLIRQLGSDDPTPEARAAQPRPEIRLPPKSNVAEPPVVAEPAVVAEPPVVAAPDAAVEAVAEPDAAVDETPADVVATPAPPTRIVKLREPDARKKKRKVRRPPRESPREETREESPPDESPPNGNWNRNALFPDEQKP